MCPIGPILSPSHVSYTSRVLPVSSSWIMPCYTALALSRRASSAAIPATMFLKPAPRGMVTGGEDVRSAVLVGDVLDEQHEQDIVLVLAGVHAAAKLVARGPEGGDDVNRTGREHPSRQPFEVTRIYVLA